MPSKKITELLGSQADSLLNHQCKTVDKSSLHLPSPHHLDSVWGQSNRSNQVLRSLNMMLDHGRLAGTGYLSILPVDQGIEHSACLLYTSDAADERSSVDLGGRRIIKKKKIL